MIQITVVDGDGDTGASAVIHGHAGHGEHGHDIVCAAISALWQVLIMGLEMIAKKYPDHVKFTRE